MKNPFKREDLYIAAKAFGTTPAGFALRSGLKFSNNWRVFAASVSILGLGLSALSAVFNRVYKGRDDAKAATPIINEITPGLNLSLHSAQNVWQEKAPAPGADVRAKPVGEPHPALKAFSKSTVPILGYSRFLAGGAYFAAGMTSNHHIEAGCGLAFLGVGWLMTKPTIERLRYATILGVPTGIALAMQGITPHFEPLFIGCGVSLTMSFVAAYASGMDKFNQDRKAVAKPDMVRRIVDAGSSLDQPPQRRQDLPPSPPALQ